MTRVSLLKYLFTNKSLKPTYCFELNFYNRVLNIRVFDPVNEFFIIVSLTLQKNVLQHIIKSK